MNKIILSSLAVIFLVPTAAWAQPKPKPRADTDIGGKYEVKFESVSSSCQNTGMNLSRATVELSRGKARSLSVTMPLVPLLRGSVGKSGKFQAKANKGRTAIQGVDGKFNVAGRVDDGVLQMVFVAEYYEGTKPLCSQSWNVSGVRGDTLD